MRVLLCDKLPDQTRVRLMSLGCEVIVDPSAKGDTLTARLAAVQPEVLVVRSTEVREPQLDAAPGLQLVVRAGAGVNTIDVATASSRGIYVANCPGKNASAVAELTIGLLLAVDRRIPEAAAELREGRWNKGAYGSARGIRGRVLGVLGLGRIGAEVARLGLALGMEVLGWSRSLDDRAAVGFGLKRYATPEEVARRADVLTVHLPLTPETRGIVGASVFRELPHGAIFLNTARSELVDQDALLQALEQKGLRAGLDVFASEPEGKSGVIDDPVARHKSVVGTHHIGASTDQAEEAVGAEVVRIVDSWRRSGQVPNCVNLADRNRPDHTLLIRHLDRVGVLASVLGHLRSANINVQEMENLIFEGRQAACARIRIAGIPPAHVIDGIRQAENVLSVSLITARGGTSP